MHTRSVFDVLPWDLLMEEGILRNTDGDLSATFRYRGPDPGAVAAGEMQDLMRLLSEAVTPLGT